MSSYLTNLAFTEQAPPLFGTVPSQTLTDAITWASDYCDGWISKRFQLPLQTWATDLQMAVFRLTVWKLVTQIGFRPGSGNNDAIQKDYDDVTAWLQKVSTGELQPNWVDSSMGNQGLEGPLAGSSPRENFQQAGVTGRGGGWFGWWGGGGGWW